jgi:hypothetical protein
VKSMSIFEWSDELTIVEEKTPQPKRLKPKKLLIVSVIMGITILPLGANGQISGENLGRIFDAVQGIGGQIRRQQNGGAQPTQAQVDADARERARLDAARRAVGETREFYGNANRGNFGSIFDQAFRLMGEFGLLDPAKARETAGVPAGGGNPGGGLAGGMSNTGKPTTVSEHVTLFNYAALRPSLVTQSSLQSIFGPEGQKLLAQQREQMVRFTMNSQELASLTNEDAKINAEIANQNAGMVNLIENLGQQSRTRQASQDVLKDLAQQYGLSGKILAGLSLQNERMGNTLSNLSGQLSIQQNQSDMQSFQLTQQLLTQAGISSQLVQVEGEIRDARNYEIGRDQSMYRGASMGQTVFIYGLNAEPGYGLPVPSSTLSGRP